MNKLLLTLFAAVIVACAFLAPVPTIAAVAFCAASAGATYVIARERRTRRRNGLIGAMNVAEGVHCGAITKKTDAAIASRYLLGKFGSDADHVAVCGAGDIPLGPITDEAAAAEDLVNVNLLGKHKDTQKMVASEAIEAGEAVFTAAGGKIQDLPAGAGTYYQVGYALQAAAADGDIIEVQDHAPIALVVP